MKITAVNTECLHLFLLFLTLITFSLCAGTVDQRQYDLDADAKDLVWCGPSRDIVFILTELNSLYKSEDKGFTWKKMNDIMSNSGKETLEENENEVK